LISKSKSKSTRRRLYRGGGAATLAVFAAIGLAACGDDDDSSDDSAASTTDASASADSSTASGSGGGGSQTVAVSETEYALDPANPTVKPGSVTFDVSNDGQIVHTLEVEGPSGEQELEADLQPGQTGKLTVDLNEPGTYEFYCPIADHKEQGMEGEITVSG
jgi:uncharacterized cupredoxin-like copper-binding protein